MFYLEHCSTNLFFQIFLWKPKSQTPTLFRLRPLPGIEEDGWEKKEQRRRKKKGTKGEQNK